MDGLVIPGGESTTMTSWRRTFDLLEPLRDRIAARHAGLRLLRRDDPARRPGRGRRSPGQQTFGGIDMTVRRNAFGRQVDSFEDDLEFAGVDGGPVHAVFIRAPWVEEVGAGRRGARRVEPSRSARRR